jgi:hypothetical protein
MHAVNQRDPHIELEKKMCIVHVRSYGRFARFPDGGMEGKSSWTGRGITRAGQHYERVLQA